MACLLFGNCGTKPPIELVTEGATSTVSATVGGFRLGGSELVNIILLLLLFLLVGAVVAVFCCWRYRRNKKKLGYDPQLELALRRPATSEVVKMVVIGDVYTGKTGLLKRYFEGSFDVDENPTAGAIFYSKTFPLDLSSYYRNADVVMMVYDITSTLSFNHLDDWAREVVLHATKPVVKVVVANKVRS